MHLILLKRPVTKKKINCKQIIKPLWSMFVEIQMKQTPNYIEMQAHYQVVHLKNTRWRD